MKELEEGELEEETSDADISDVCGWQYQLSTSENRLEKLREELEECEIHDEKGEVFGNGEVCDILWHGRKVSVGKAASDLPEELFLAFEEVVDELLQQSCFGGLRCDNFLAAYNKEFPSSAKEFKRIARLNSCSSKTLVKLCLSRLNKKFKVFPKECWNDDGDQSSDVAVIRRKEPRMME